MMEADRNPTDNIKEISRSNSDGEVTVHVQGTVTEWITSDISFERVDRGSVRDTKLDGISAPEYNNDH